MAIYGADISAFQEGFDFRANSGECGFVFIKQTEGLTWPDRDDPNSTRVLREMRSDAQNVHEPYIYVGLYHFGRPSPNRTGVEEAQHFIDFVDYLDPNEGVVLDLETNNGLSGEELEDWALQFVDTIEAQWPGLVGNVLLYSYPDFLYNMSTDRLSRRCPLWIAAYGSNNGEENPGSIYLDRWETYCFWQFTSRGTVEGYDGHVDMNRYEASEETLASLGAGNREVMISPPAVPAGEFIPEAWHGEYLRRGSEGIRVVQIQQRLARRGWRIGIDGFFGLETDTVVRKFQAEKGLRVDGVVGRITWDKMYAFFEGVDVIPPPVVVPQPLPPAPEIGDGLLHPDPRGQCEAWGFDGNVGMDPVREFQRAFAFYPITVDGIPGPQTAKAVQVVIDSGDKLSPHFAIWELRCRHCGRIRALREELESAESLREEVGLINVVSAYRCPEHNAAIGGAPNSQHPMGAAIDMNVPLVATWSRFAGVGRCWDRALHGDRRDRSGNNTTGGRVGAPTEWDYC